MTDVTKKQKIEWEKAGLPAQTRAPRAPGGPISGDISEGTPPSNTVPSNSNRALEFKALRFGIDSLYLSYPGKLSETWDQKLSSLKEQAQSEKESEQARAQVTIASHLFEVRDKGLPRFAYVLVDNCFFIKLSRTGVKNLPMAHVQISSEYLAAVGPEAAEKDLSIVINTLGLVLENPNVSRADLFLDFVCQDDLNTVEETHWITRANLMAKYFDCRLKEPFTGWVIGIGGQVHARLYDKTVEIVYKSHKYFLFELWEAAGWRKGDRVWRIEFQAQREVLKELLIYTLDDLLNLEASLWRYLTQNWLRLVVPNPCDQTPSRWPDHSLWTAVSKAYAQSSDQSRLTRFRTGRLPSDERLFVHGLGPLTSFMARQGIEDFGEGLGEYLDGAHRFHKSRGDNFYSYIGRKIKVKGRKYNTINNRGKRHETIPEHSEQVKAYRKAKDGDEDV